MLTNVDESVDISHNVKSDFKSPCLKSLSGNSANIFLIKVSFSISCLNLKAKKVKPHLKLNFLFTNFVVFLLKVVRRSFEVVCKLPHPISLLRCLAVQILAMKPEFVSFKLLWVAIRSFSNN